MTLSEFGEGVTFHIVKKNFRVDVDPEIFFKSKGTALNPPPPPEVDAERTSLHNVVPNVFGGAGLWDEIEQLRAEGIEVDDDNEPLPEEAAAPPPDPEGTQYNWEKPTLGGAQEKMSFFQIASGPILSIPIYLKTCLYGPCKFSLKKNDPFLTYEPPKVSVFFI